VAAHYDNQKVALLLLEKGASPHATAKVSSCPTPEETWPEGGPASAVASWPRARCPRGEGTAADSVSGLPTPAAAWGTSAQWKEI